jgi:hypothetical protein
MPFGSKTTDITAIHIVPLIFFGRMFYLMFKINIHREAIAMEYKLGQQLFCMPTNRLQIAFDTLQSEV